MKWALLGASDVAATRVLPALRACGEDVRTVYSASPERGRDFAAQHRIPASAGSLEAALDDVDAVYVSSTNDLHHSQTIAALSRGVHVLCEKPLALSVKEATEMVEAAQASDTVLATNHHLRSNPALQAIRHGLMNGEIGELLSVRVDNAGLLPERLRGWRLKDPTGGGVVLDLTVHDVDVIRFITGLEPTSISAAAVSQLLAVDVPDAVMTAGVLGDRALFSTHDAFTVAHNTTSVVVHGTEGTFAARDCLTPDPRGALGVVRHGIYSPFPHKLCDDLYTPGVLAFRDAVEGRGDVAADGIDGLRSLITALAAQTSLSEARTVTIPPVSRPTAASPMNEEAR